MNRRVLLSTLAVLVAACAVSAEPQTAPLADATEPANAPVQIYATPVPAGKSTAAMPPTNAPTREPTVTPTPAGVTPGTQEVIYYRGDFELKGFLCIPEGAGPFPAVVYNHGGLGDQIGGAPVETCEALAQDGFVGFSPMRRQTRSLEGHLDDVLAGVDYVKSLDYVDSDRLGIMGFSRGALLTFEAGIRRSDFEAIIIMAVAPGRGNLEELLPEAASVSAPVLLLVSENDTLQGDSVLGVQMVKEALESAGKPVTQIVYPPYQNDGHKMFFEVGDYWSDVQRFLDEHLRE